MGRPSKYTPEVVDRVCEGIRLGLTYELAAAYGGISYRSFATWRERFPQFLQAVSEAEARGAAVTMARIQKEAQEGEWRAAAWIMEHRYPDQYGRSVRDERHVYSGELLLRRYVGVDPDDV